MAIPIPILVIWVVWLKRRWGVACHRCSRSYWAMQWALGRVIGIGFGGLRINAMLMNAMSLSFKREEWVAMEEGAYTIARGLREAVGVCGGSDSNGLGGVVVHRTVIQRGSSTTLGFFTFLFFFFFFFFFWELCLRVSNFHSFWKKIPELQTISI